MVWNVDLLMVIHARRTGTFVWEGKVLRTCRIATVRTISSKSTPVDRAHVRKENEDNGTFECFIEAEDPQCLCTALKATGLLSCL